MQPSDSLISFGQTLRSSLASSPTTAQAHFVSLPCAHLLRTGLGVIDRRSASPILICGDMRASQVTGPSSSCVPWPKTPPSSSSASHPLTQLSMLPSCSCTHSALGMTSISWLHHGPHVCVPTLRRPHCCCLSKARYRPGADLPLIGRASHPLDDSSEVSTGPSHSLIPLDQQCLVARKT